MTKVALAFSFTALLCLHVAGQPCLERAREVKPELSAEVRKTYDKKLAEAFEDFYRSNRSADSVIWLGRRIAYIGNYKDAIRMYTAGLQSHPNDARFYRHRGHRYITLRCFDDAIKDLETAGSLVRGKPDEVEPDGLPNARNIPTSTLQSNIWYHLGLAYYLKGDLANALKAYEEAEKVSKNPDMLVATKHWQYMTLHRMGKEKEAAQAVAGIPDNLDIIENHDYYKLIKLYQGKISSEALSKEITGKASTLSSASLGYGLGNWFLYNNRPEEAITIFRQITNGSQWASFGFIAAEAELAKARPLQKSARQ